VRRAGGVGRIEGGQLGPPVFDGGELVVQAQARDLRFDILQLGENGVQVGLDAFEVGLDRLERGDQLRLKPRGLSGGDDAVDETAERADAAHDRRNLRQRRDPIVVTRADGRDPRCGFPAIAREILE